MLLQYQDPDSACMMQQALHSRLAKIPFWPRQFEASLHGITVTASPGGGGALSLASGLSSVWCVVCGVLGTRQCAVE